MVYISVYILYSCNIQTCKAESGQALNQSIVQQLTSAGNCLNLARNISPMGLQIVLIETLL